LAQAATLAALAAVYFAAGKLGLFLAVVHPIASPVWPASGIAIAAVLLLGQRVWPALFAAAFLVNVSAGAGIASSLGIAVGNSLEAVVGGWLGTRFARGVQAFERSQDVFEFVVLAGLLATTISATIGTTPLAFAGSASWADYGRIC
jgi:integral membrane sensor domain MASE1